MNQDNQDQSGHNDGRDRREGFDKDQPSEVAGHPIHQGNGRMGESQGLRYKSSRERAGIAPESPR
jgi:hypothetical protein